MNVNGKTVVVTGGAGGIGAALCRRFAREGARGVVVADVDEAAAAALAEEINGLAVHCDVSREAEIAALVEQARAHFGPVDLFCSNAGIIIKGQLEVSDRQWQRIWQINVMAHVHAARAVIPGMLSRGGGGFIITASAAGLLNQIDSAPYSTTKHAAVGLADNLAINYGDRGIYVAVICPMAVKTHMTRHGGGIAALDGMLEAEQVADSVIQAMGAEHFMILPHPEVKTYFQKKAGNYEGWLKAMQRLRAQHLENPTETV